MSNTQQNTSNAGNFFIPIMLLLVATIVIVATFYDNDKIDTALNTSEDKASTASQNSVQISEPETTPEITKAASKSETKNTDTVGAQTEKKNTDVAETDSTSTHKSQPDQPAFNTVQEVNTSESTVTSSSDSVENPGNSTNTTGTEQIASSTQAELESEPTDNDINDLTYEQRKQRAEKRMVEMRERSAQRRASFESARLEAMRYPMYDSNRRYNANSGYHAMPDSLPMNRRNYPTPYQRQRHDQNAPQFYSQNMSKATNRGAKIEQPRKEYETEMQNRIQRYQAARDKARELAEQAKQETRKLMAETQKAVYQHQGMANGQNKEKLQEMHKRISEIHSEIHQLMRESNRQIKASQPMQIKAPNKEQI